MVPQQVSFVERSSLSQRVPYRRFHCSQERNLLHNRFAGETRRDRAVGIEAIRSVDPLGEKLSHWQSIPAGHLTENTIINILVVLEIINAGGFTPKSFGIRMLLNLTKRNNFLLQSGPIFSLSYIFLLASRVGVCT